MEANVLGEITNFLVVQIFRSLVQQNLVQYYLKQPDLNSSGNGTVFDITPIHMSTRFSRHIKKIEPEACKN